MDGKETDDPSDDETEKYSTLKEDAHDKSTSILLQKNAQECLMDL